MFRLHARTVFLQLLTLCTALGVLWTPIAEAAECSDEPEAASLIEQHGQPEEDDNAPEKPGTCVHGHCHHASQAIKASADSVRHMTAATLLTSIVEPPLDGSATQLATPPPRA
ncbi:hypothetical protein MB02_11615 [Croceicoccus estronivorus]|uniref:hypothetical protein n=1 Tax=Croceicoccus estronivorus TaxID=1172626 RepID=UPI000832EB99|nr:hypothetical protein [Croceicoccus estronivorus]OCC23284.1 hypothetical protein MB02_11615 [Croceicoccus estronivorus]